MANLKRFYLDNSKANEVFSIETPTTPLNLLNAQFTMSKTWDEIRQEAFGTTGMGSNDSFAVQMFYIPNTVLPSDVFLMYELIAESDNAKLVRIYDGYNTVYPSRYIGSGTYLFPQNLPWDLEYCPVNGGIDYPIYNNIRNTKLTPNMSNMAYSTTTANAMSYFLSNPQDHYLLMIISNIANSDANFKYTYATKSVSELLIDNGVNTLEPTGAVCEPPYMDNAIEEYATQYKIAENYVSINYARHYYLTPLFLYRYIDHIDFKLTDKTTGALIWSTTRNSNFYDGIQIPYNLVYNTKKYILTTDYTFTSLANAESASYNGEIIVDRNNAQFAPAITIPTTLSATYGDLITFESTIGQTIRTKYINRADLYFVDINKTIALSDVPTTISFDSSTLQLTSSTQRVVVRYYADSYKDRYDSNVCLITFIEPPFESPTITTPATTNVNLGNSITYGFTLNNLVNRISTMDVVISSGGVSVHSAMGLKPATSYTLPANTLYYGDEYTLALTLRCVNGTDVSSDSVTFTYIAPSTLPDMPTPTVADMVLDPYRVNVITPWERANLITTTAPSLTTSKASIMRIEDANGSYNGQYHISVYNNSRSRYSFKICDIPSNLLSKRVYLKGGTGSFKLYIGKKDTTGSYCAMMSETDLEYYTVVSTDSGSGASYTLPSAGEFGIYVSLPETNTSHPTYEGDVYPRLSFNDYLPSITTFTETSVDLSTIVTAQLMLADDTNEIYEALNINLAKNAVNIGEYSRLSDEYNCNICLTDTYRRKWISDDFKITLQHLTIETPTLIAEELLTFNPSNDFVGHVALNNPAECISSINISLYLSYNYGSYNVTQPFDPRWHKMLSQNINVDLATGAYFIPAETLYWCCNDCYQYAFLTVIGVGGETIQTDALYLAHLNHHNPDVPIDISASMNVQVASGHISGTQMDVIHFDCTNFNYAKEVWFVRDCNGDPSATTTDMRKTLIYTNIPVSKDYEVGALSIPFSKEDEAVGTVPYNYLFMVRNSYNELFNSNTAKLRVYNTMTPLNKPSLTIPDNFIVTDPLPIELAYNNYKSNLKYATINFYEHGTTTLAFTYVDRALTGSVTLPANTLPDGDYDVVVTIEDIFFQTKDSDVYHLTAFTPPVFTFNMPENNILDVTHYEFECKAVDYEAYVPSMRLKLYVGDKLIALSPLYENVYGRIGIKHRFIDLKDATEYRIECEIDLGTIQTKVAETFYVDYHKPTAYSLLYLDNKCNDGYVGIRGHVVSSHAETFPEQPTFIGGEWIDLVGGDPYVYWDNGFQIPDSFTFGAWMKYANLGKLITLGSAVNGYTIELVRGTESGTVKYRYVVRGYVDGVKTFERVSSAFGNLCQDSSGYILFRKNGNTYTFSVTMSDTTTNENWVWGADTGVTFGYNTQKQWGDSDTTMPTFETLTTDMESIFPLGQVRICGGKYDCVWITSDVTTPFANITMPTDWDNNTRFLCLFTDDSVKSGNINEVLNMFPKLKIKRHKKGGENDWVTLKVVDMTELLGEDTEWKDYFVPHGYDAEYALVPTTANGDEGGYIIGDIKTSFNVYTIADANNAFAFKAEVRNPLNRNTQIGMFTLPIGNFPILQRNNELDYDNGTFSTKILGYDYDSTHRLDRKDISKQTEDICNFLNDFNAKVLKDWNGGIWIVRFNEGVKQESGNTDLDMSISAPWVEQGIFDNQADLYYNGLSTELTP